MYASCCLNAYLAAGTESRVCGRAVRALCLIFIIVRGYLFSLLGNIQDSLEEREGGVEGIGGK